MKGMSSTKNLRIRLDRSLYGQAKTHQACARGLGLRKPHQVVAVEDTPENRGMVRKVQYMVTVLEES